MIAVTQTTDEYSYELKIPKDRVAVLIGKSGDIKKQLESSTNTSINVDSEEGDVNIKGFDALSLYAAKEVVRAIGRGFNPELSQLLLKQDYGLEVINISEQNSPNELVRLRGRLIGEEGKARRVIEELTGTHISIYGKTVSIIGQFEGLSLARKAIEMLVTGAPHATVYRFLERHHKELM